QSSQARQSRWYCRNRWESRSVPFFTRKPLLETVKGFFRLDTYSVFPCRGYCLSFAYRSSQYMTVGEPGPSAAAPKLPLSCNITIGQSFTFHNCFITSICLLPLKDVEAGPAEAIHLPCTFSHPYLFWVP
ncbi:hypothetical protein, partial [uncultured Sphingobacterium sp.]|uniref:hypothetical protein n=1 Tax=uncultured Sphingobacterium sp. TaxID=182688 RepID=UPI0025CF1383